VYSYVFCCPFPEYQPQFQAVKLLFLYIVALVHDQRRPRNDHASLVSMEMANEILSVVSEIQKKTRLKKAQLRTTPCIIVPACGRGGSCWGGKIEPFPIYIYCRRFHLQQDSTISNELDLIQT
jgi:hypothetical protein